jgi:hypothetical protein
MYQRGRRVFSIALLVGWLLSSLIVHGVHDCRSHGSHAYPVSMAAAASDARSTHVCAFHPRPVRHVAQRSVVGLPASRDGASVKIPGHAVGGTLQDVSFRASGCLACAYLALAAVHSDQDAPETRDRVLERSLFFSRVEASEPLAGAAVPRGPPTIL